MDQVTQRNASAAEELSSTAEELSAQAEALQQLMDYFKVPGGEIRVIRPPAHRNGHAKSMALATVRRGSAAEYPSASGGEFRAF
jgi:methyl-accepting chemotaxis protein